MPRNHLRAVIDGGAVINPGAAIGNGTALKPGVVIEHGTAIKLLAVKGEWASGTR